MFLTNGFGGDANGDLIFSFENLIGSAKDDKLTGSMIANAIEGRAGNDTIEGRGGDDILKGNSGIDTVSYVSAAMGVTVDLSSTTEQDTVGAGKDTLTGFENLTGSDKDDKLTGNAGDNIIEGGKGDDTLDGGGGIDTLSFANASGVIYASLSDFGAVITGNGTDTLLNFENI